MSIGEPISKIYVLCHTRTAYEGIPAREEDLTKNLFYSTSKERCEAEIAHYKTTEGFADYPEGFEVMVIELEQRYWETGFFTSTYRSEHRDDEDRPV